MMWHIGELLIQKKLISWDQLSDALEEQQQTREVIGEILVRKGAVGRLLLFQNLAGQHHLRFVALHRTKINPKAVRLVPKSIAEKFRIMPFEILDKTLIVAIGHPGLRWPEEEIRMLANVERIQTVLSFPEEIPKAIEEFYAPAPARA
ncbi:MAG: hypothetical protein WC352_05440 [Candidatus Omnitrophota bacterium]|jgi:type IV pilus assembly protein PilB